jgi:3-oxoacyl-[acyl-carrier protein] reductase
VRVTAVSRSAARLEALVDAIVAAGGAADHLVLDLGDPDRVERAVTARLERTGPIQILVNNTGGPSPGPVLEADDAAFMAGFTAHLIAARRLVRLLLPGMRQSGSGRIINIVSTSVRQPIPNLGVSNTVRAAVAGWAKTLAGEVGRFGVTVNNVLPGYIDTERLRELAADVGARRGDTVEAVLASWAEAVPLGRIGRPEEIAAAVAFLASPAASYIHGTSLPVDGGRIVAL